MATCITGHYDGVSVAVKQFKRSNLHELIVEANVLRDLQTIRHNEHFSLLLRSKQSYTTLRLGNTAAILPNGRKKRSLNFYQALKIDGLLNKNDIVQLLDGTPEGFQYINDAGWRHNDLKENNVMVKKCNRQKHPVAVIIDFGKSRRINDLKDTVQ